MLDRLLPAAIVGQRYRLDGVLGQGGFGQVWAATNVATLGRVALKVLNGAWRSQPDARLRFLREARAVTAIRHPNVVRVHDIFELDDETPVMVMDLLEGETLRQRLGRDRSLPLPTVADIFLPVVSALGTAHATGIVHRDLKPENVFLVVAPGGRHDPRVLDFGLAKLAPGALASREVGLSTRSGDMLGTMGYMPPEQTLGAKELDHRADIWALGVMLYEALTGSSPLGHGLPQFMSYLVGQTDITPLERIVREIPADVAELVNRMLSRDAAARPEDLREVLRVVSPHSRVEVPPFGSALGMRSATQPPPLDLVTLQRGSAIDVTLALPAQHDSEPFWTHTPTFALHSGRARSGLLHVARTAVIFAFAWRDEPDKPDPALASLAFERAAVDLDALWVPMALVNRNSGELERWAHALRDAVRSACDHAVSLLFVTNELGSPIVKHALQHDALGAMSATGRSRRQALGFRARQIVELTSKGSEPYRPLEDLPEALHQANVDFTVYTGQVDACGLPRPVQRRLESTGDSAALDAASLASALAQLVDFPRYAAHRDLLVAAETVSRAFDLDRATNTEALIGPPGPDSEAQTQQVVRGPSTLEYTIAGTQRDVQRRLLGALRSKASRPRRFVITGDAGVGKSTLVRRMARDLALQALEGPGLAPLPVLVPLQQEILSASELASLSACDTPGRGRALFLVIARRWCDWVNALLAEQNAEISIEWLEKRLASLPSLLILDAVDEFLVNNPAVGLGEFREMLSFVASAFSGNGQLDLLVVVRSSQPGIRTLPSNATHLFEVVALNLEQAAQAFPDVSALVATIDDPEVAKLILTPLILSWLGPRAGRLPRQRLQTPAEVIEQALIAIIEESHLTELAFADLERTDVRQWLDAMTLIGWIFYSTVQVQLSVEDLAVEAQRLLRVWSAFSEEHSEDEQSYLMVKGFRLVSHDATIGPLLRRTVFVPTGAGRIRFVHREWLSFLAARYYALCIASGHVEQMGLVGIEPTVHTMAGHLLTRDHAPLDLSVVRRILARSRETAVPFITSNFLALLTSSSVPVNADAIALLLSAFEQMPLLAKVVALNGLGMRALRDTDAAAREFRLQLAPLFAAQLAGAHPAHPVLASIAWCYAKAYSVRFNLAPPQKDWSFPELPDAEQAVLRALCSITDDGPRLLAEHRTTQTAYLQTQFLVLKSRFRPILSVHFLYLLVIAHRYGAGTDDVARELPAILDPESAIGSVYMSYDVVPEVARVYALCQRLYASAP